MALQGFDEINYRFEIDADDVHAELRRYFEPMEISDEQKQERVDIAYDIYVILLYFFSLVVTRQEYEMLDRDMLLQHLHLKWLELYYTRSEIDDYIKQYVEEIVEKIVDTTLEHLKENNAGNYYTSEKRAINIAENEANSILNYLDLRKAKEKGYRYKQWQSMKDIRVRHSHMDVDDMKVPIDGTFLVGKSLMKMPRDFSMGASIDEIAGCRCSLKYIR